LDEAFIVVGVPADTVVEVGDDVNAGYKPDPELVWESDFLQWKHAFLD